MVYDGFCSIPCISLTLSLPLATIVDTVPVPLATKVDRTPLVPLAITIAVSPYLRTLWGGA